MIQLGPAFLIVACACTAQPSLETGNNGIVPLRIDHLAGGAWRYTAEVQIGDAPPFEAFVDTGSEGLRVLPGLIDDSAYDDIDDVLVSYSYHSGLALQGVVARGRVTLGGLTTSAIPIMRIRDVGCTYLVPDCDAAGKSASDYLAFGYRAILGIGMRNTPGNAGIANPIVQLDGHPAFAVHSPDYGGTAGTLQIAPPSAEVARYHTVMLAALAGGEALADGSPTWDDRTVPTCITDVTSNTGTCAGGILDTGASISYVLDPAFVGTSSQWPSGHEVAVQIGNLGTYDFTISATPIPGIDDVRTEPLPVGTSPLINLGTALFFHYDALFDQAEGRIGLAPHER
jgi:hypothetical protein